MTLELRRDLGVRNQRVVDVLKTLLNDDDKQLRIFTYATLSSKKYFNSPGVHQMLLKGLSDPDSLVRYNVINFLRTRGKDCSFALGKLKQIIENTNTEERALGQYNLRAAAERAVRSIQGNEEKGLVLFLFCSLSIFLHI